VPFGNAVIMSVVSPEPTSHTQAAVASTADRETGRV
jgi:hypothetical protein